jgi:hypothetical protein
MTGPGGPEENTGQNKPKQRKQRGRDIQLALLVASAVRNSLWNDHSSSEA